MLQRRRNISPRQFHHLFRASRGATVIEYLIGVIVIGLALLAVMALFGDSIMSAFRDASGSVEAIGEVSDDEARESRRRNAANDSKDQQEGYSVAGDSEASTYGASGDGHARTRPSREREEREELSFFGGFNPLVVLLMLFFLGLLGYVMFSNKKD